MATKVNTTAGRWHKLTGESLLVGGTLAAIVLNILPDDWWLSLGAYSKWLTMAVALLVVVTGAFLLYYGKQLANKARAEVVLYDDIIDNVLYLRAFTDDVSRERYLFQAVFSSLIVNGMTTLEEELAEAFEPFGDLIAIGKPGERLPLPGASRAYAGDNWQDVVIDYMKSSNLVLFLAGEGTGLKWEVSKALEIVDRRKLFFLVKMKAGQYARFRQEMQALAGISLPMFEQVKTTRNAAFGFIRLLNSQAEFFAARGPFLRVAGIRPMKNRLAFALKTVYEEYGYPWRMPERSRLLLVGLALFGIFIFVAAISGLSDTFEEMRSPNPPGYAEKNQPPLTPNKTEDENTTAPPVHLHDGEADAAAGEPAMGNVTAFILTGYKLLASKAGDLNRDPYPDAILVLQSEEEGNSANQERPLLLLAGNASGNYELMGHNERLVFCGNCGGLTGDPFRRLVIKNGYFSVEQEGGSSDRWKRITTFRHDAATGLFILSRDAKLLYSSVDPPAEQEEVLISPGDFDQLLFGEYSNLKDW